MRDAHFNGVKFADQDPDQPLEPIVGCCSIVFRKMLRLPPSNLADVRERLARLFRTVLTRHVCSGSSSDRPMMRRFKKLWLKLASDLDVAVPTVAYHCWCKTCSDEGRIAPVKSLSLCSRGKIASYASVDCLKRCVGTSGFAADAAATGCSTSSSARCSRRSSDRSVLLALYIAPNGS